MDDFRKLHIKASDKQLSRLRNGHRVRIQEAMEGKGVNLIVHPGTYNPVVKAFAKSKGAMVQLTPDEILLNKAQGPSGSGIFGKKFDRFVRKTIGKKAKDTLYGATDKYIKPIAKTAIKDLAKMAPELGATALSGLATYAGQPELVPMAEELGSKLGKIAGDAGAKYATGKLDGKGLSPGGFGLYAGSSRLMGRGRRELSSVGCGGRLLRGQGHLPPALMSQPYSANFQFQHTLPPAYIQHIKGNGLTP